MKISSIKKASLFLLLIGFPLLAQTQGGQLTVSARMDIYRAAGFDDGSDGIPPAQFVFTAGPGQTLAFLKVAGMWTCRNAGGVPYYGPDGKTVGGPCPPESNPAIGPFAGYYATDYQGAMVGMFLEDQLPTVTPPPTRFFVANGYAGGLKTDFPALAPQIGQVFFIGDGLTGTGSGNIQVFAVPPNATHLYLGYVDGCQPGIVASGCFTDNGGSLQARFAIYNASGGHSN